MFLQGVEGVLDSNKGVESAIAVACSPRFERVSHAHWWVSLGIEPVWRGNKFLFCTGSSILTATTVCDGSHVYLGVL